VDDDDDDDDNNNNNDDDDDDDDDDDVFIWSSPTKFCSCSPSNQFQIIAWNWNFRWCVYKMPPVALFSANSIQSTPTRP